MFLLFLKKKTVTNFVLTILPAAFISKPVSLESAKTYNSHYQARQLGKPYTQSYWSH
jgi:hypothetical protein